MWENCEIGKRVCSLKSGVECRILHVECTMNDMEEGKKMMM